MSTSARAVQMFLDGRGIAAIVDRCGITVDELFVLLRAEGVASPPLETLQEWYEEDRE